MQLALSPARQSRKPFSLRRMTASLALATFGGLAGCGVAQAANHALIMTIGTYEDPAANLPGIDLDAANAARIAEKMGVPPANTTYLKDDQLTEDGFRKAFEAMSDRIGQGDNVFLYYSGHGTQLDAGGGKCAEGMVTYDLHAYRDTELQRSLARLSDKAGQLVMMNDSCFSGGQAKSTKDLVAGTRAKTYKMSETPEGYSCGDAVNKAMTRNMVVRAKAGGSNFLYVAASAENEVAHASRKGSAATLAWVDCLGAGNDSDHSGRSLVKRSSRVRRTFWTGTDSIRPSPCRAM